MTLTGFLLARIAEDEINRVGYPGRVLRECEAKRRIVWTCVSAFRGVDNPPDWIKGQRASAYGACKALAAVYADHPDYREEWLP